LRRRFRGRGGSAAVAVLRASLEKRRLALADPDAEASLATPV
jgi:hypothetical protein